MKYEDFKKLKASEKWFYMWTALDNHLGQVREIKWYMRVIIAGIVVYFVRHLLTQ